MPFYERYASFYPNSDVNAEECALKLAHYLAPLDYAFITPTETGLKKSIMDAIIGVRSFLESKGLHNYENQAQGPEHKAVLPAYFVEPDGFIETKASLYRPITKQGDPRIWFSGLKEYASAKNLLMLVSFEGAIFVINLSRREIWKSIEERGIVFEIFQKVRDEANSSRNELIMLLKQINQQGWFPSITPGDPGVGDTLEHALGIQRNNSKLPDFHGIELKATRLTKNGLSRAATRSTLFTKTPDDGFDYHQILDAYGRIQTPKGMSQPRLQLYETFSTQRVNGYDLYLGCDSHLEKVLMFHSSARVLGDPNADFVSSWNYKTLQNSFAKKHPETMWVGAESKIIDGREYFKYTVAQYTSKPNTTALIDLIGKGIVTLDLAAHLESNGKYRDHGMLWKIKPKNRALIVGTVEDIKL